MNKSLKQSMKYKDLTDTEKTELFTNMYVEECMSWAEIADALGTYAQKVRRDALKLGIKSRSKSETQKLVLEMGKAKHPTKGVGHKEAAKIKISNGNIDYWENATEEQKEQRREIAKKLWEGKTEKEIRELREAAGEGIRKAAREGSALEKYLLKELVKAGYSVEFHKECWVVQQRLQIDLFMPKENIAIEVDGPTHFEAVWSETNLQKNKLRDNEKNGLLLKRGSVIIRIIQDKMFNMREKRELVATLIDHIEKIRENRPTAGNRVIYIGGLNGN